MRRFVALILIVLLLTPLAGEVGAAGNAQPLFKIDMTIKVAPVVIENTSTWLGTFKMYVVLTDPHYRAYFDYLASNNTTAANEEFKSFVKELVYDNMKDNLEKRYEAANVSSTIYLPSGGPVKVLDNWSAVVTFAVTNFLVSDGKTLRCPATGNLDFVYKGHVFDYTWNRLTLILPQDYEIANLAPVPDDLSDNVAVWNNGDFIPLIELYTRVYSYVRFLNATRKEISLQYDPHEGYVQFNATFTGANATPVIISQLLASFKATMNIMSIDTRQENGSLVVIGIARPEVAYKETSSEKIWKAMVKLPGAFDSISVVGGSYVVAPDHTIIITVTEKKSTYRFYAYGIAAVLVVVAVLIVVKRRGTKEETETEPEEPGEEEPSPESEEQESPEEDEGGGE
ncbi:hypothetical protein [Thermococcus radiotolerans]|uniref:Uncharacterized protein n=1 Tax=Thermococcus radiotolerans TaxID=187880 RepID=A0A2Z2N3N0_9EURY|nr:hypothetical protein [Thermococcus radiotolerans]ASJ15163.1 hypothetical protein A3L10_08490 [Thermococcus radiotolerans]